MFVSPQEYFRLKDARPRKRFGQHFLTQPGIAERIVDSAGLHPTDVAVEVGPGLGALTRFILPRVQGLHLVEVDRDLAGYLESNASYPGCHVRVHRADILQFDFHSLSEAEGQRLMVLGNLPYNISSPLGFHLLESLSGIKGAVFMVQKEVGERWLAAAGGKDYGVLSVLFGIYAQATPLFTVEPGQFYPAPKVDSLVLRLDFRKSAPSGAPPFDFIRRLVSVAFQQRRKTLQNCLKGYQGQKSGFLSEVFESMGIHPQRRPETLSPSEFLSLAQGLFEM